MWDAIDAHPQGAKAPGFATWMSAPTRSPWLTRSRATSRSSAPGSPGRFSPGGSPKPALDVVVLEAGEAIGLTWDDYQENIRQFLGAAAKVPNAAWPNSPAAPSPNVLDIGAVTPDGPPGTAGYFVQMGPIPFGSDYQRSRGGTTLHWYGHSIRMLPAGLRDAFDLRRRCRLADRLRRAVTVVRAGGVGDRCGRRRRGSAARRRTFPPGYVYPMHKVPPSYLDRWLGERLDGTPVAIGDATYEHGRRSRPRRAQQHAEPGLRRRRRLHARSAPWDEPETGLRCEGNASCIPACPAQAKYSALKTLAAAARAGARIVHQSVATKVVLGTAGEVTGIDYLGVDRRHVPQSGPGRSPRPATCSPRHSVENAKLLLMSGAGQLQ